MKKIIFITCLMFFSYSLYAQEHGSEVTSTVKELSEFHTVIYKLWHTAWPKKDIKMLNELLPEVENGAKNVISAKLPGILREKKEKWEAGVAELSKRVDEYKSASAQKDSVKLLSAAENLHSGYEALVRIIRPVLKEVDSFHQELYMLYHYYSPESNIEKINASAKILKEKGATLKDAKLPERLISKKDKYESFVAQLNEAVIKLNSDVAGKKIDTIKKSVNNVHDKYQKLERLFE